MTRLFVPPNVARRPPADLHFSLTLRIGWSLFIVVLLIVYLAWYGPTNFVWFSDIALFGSAVAMWLRSPLVASMMALAVLIPELGWNLDFFCGLLTGHHPFGIAAYMWSEEIPRLVRLMSLFHVPLPPLLLYLVYRLGYDPRAIWAQTLLAFMILPITYVATDPADNVNWVFGPGSEPQTLMPRWAYMLTVLLAYPLLFYLPVHLLLDRLWGPSREELRAAMPTLHPGRP